MDLMDMLKFIGVQFGAPTNCVSSILETNCQLLSFSLKDIYGS